MTVKEKEKKLELTILNGEANGPDGSYLYYGVPEGVTLIRGRVRFWANYECRGEGVQYRFFGKASCSFSGVYEETFEVTLPHTLPASSLNDHGRVSYVVEARLIRKWSLDVVETKEIWFSPTTLPSPAWLTSGLHVVPPPATTFGYWKNALPCGITLPSNALYLGQKVPVHIRLDPFLSTSVVAGQGFKMLQPKLRLKQYKRLASTSGNSSTNRYKRNVVEIALTHWPQQQVVQGFEDTVMMQLPLMPELTPSTETSVYTVQHSVNLVVGMIVNGLGGIMKFKVKVHITGPRPDVRYLPYIIKDPRDNAGEVS
ncbi:hypothetical protein EDD11_001183 [Mortierella claussenii]|nr:hypothetical protein EDD11_001183 [Mortierella claussenii]